VLAFAVGGRRFGTHFAMLVVAPAVAVTRCTARRAAVSAGETGRRLTRAAGACPRP
jgi:hypothetical protein